MVSAALVTVRSSGRWVGSLLVPLSTWTCIGEPLGDGGATELKSDPSTTRIVVPIPDTRSMVGLENDDATVAAACSLPAEKNTVVEFSGPG